MRTYTYRRQMVEADVEVRISACDACGATHECELRDGTPASEADQTTIERLPAGWWSLKISRQIDDDDTPYDTREICKTCADRLFGAKP